jgi:hypothetical protein
MTDIFDTVLLLALPASGKSEVRRFLEYQDAQTCAERFHMGPTVQLDDYPYVHLMRCVDVAMADMGEEPIFFQADDGSFEDPIDWGTLIALLNEDFEDIRNKEIRKPTDPVRWFFDRVDRARAAVKGKAAFGCIKEDTRAALASTLTEEIVTLLNDWNSSIPESLEGKTIVIEFARGGPEGSTMPFPLGFGYGHSLSLLSSSILDRAMILYVWVTPEQSRQKNRERARPGADGSILFHGVPEHVMIHDYGCDDMEYLVERSAVAGTVEVASRGANHQIPVGRFDNRKDLTTFIREAPEHWDERDVDRLRDGLARTLDDAWKIYSRRFGG